jgi:hypothetical protein
MPMHLPNRQGPGNRVESTIQQFGPQQRTRDQEAILLVEDTETLQGSHPAVEEPGYTSGAAWLASRGDK